MVDKNLATALGLGLVSALGCKSSLKHCPEPLASICAEQSIRDGIYSGRVAYFDSSDVQLHRLTFAVDQYMWIHVRNNDLSAIEPAYPIMVTGEQNPDPESQLFWQEVRRVAYIKVLDCSRFETIPCTEDDYLGGGER